MDRMRNTSVTFEDGELVMVRQTKEDEWVHRRYAGMIEGAIWPDHCYEGDSLKPWRYVSKIKNG